jgi:hypothetical protein
MRNQIDRLLRLRTRDGQTLIEFTLLFSLIALVGLTILTAVQTRSHVAPPVAMVMRMR